MFSYFDLPFFLVLLVIFLYVKEIDCLGQKLQVVFP